MSDFTHIVRLYPAFDDPVNGCSHKTKGDHGRGPVKLVMASIRNNHAAAWTWHTGIQVSSTCTTPGDTGGISPTVSTDLLYGGSGYEFINAITLDKALASKRCAQGSLAVATKLLGGEWGDYETVLNAVQGRLGTRLWVHNDEMLPDDPFEAGQQLAQLFRETADSL